MSSPKRSPTVLIARIVAPTRRRVEAHARSSTTRWLISTWPGTAEADWWDVDGVICALGTTRADTGSDQAFRVVDHDYKN